MSGADKAVEIIKALGPFIQAATPLILGVLAWLLTARQTRKLMSHSDANRDKITAQVASSTGTFKQLEG